MEIGIELEKMEGFSDKPLNGIRGTRSWEKIIDPIALLINHSDCDGRLTASQCAAVFTRLRMLVSDWQDGDHDKRHALLLADAMEYCAMKNKSLIFT